MDGWNNNKKVNSPKTQEEYDADKKYYFNDKWVVDVPCVRGSCRGYHPSWKCPHNNFLANTSAYENIAHFERVEK